MEKESVLCTFFVWSHSCAVCLRAFVVPAPKTFSYGVRSYIIAANVVWVLGGQIYNGAPVLGWVHILVSIQQRKTLTALILIVSSGDNSLVHCNSQERFILVYLAHRGFSWLHGFCNVHSLCRCSVDSHGAKSSLSLGSWGPSLSYTYNRS